MGEDDGTIPLGEGQTYEFDSKEEGDYFFGSLSSYTRRNTDAWQFVECLNCGEKVLKDKKVVVKSDKPIEYENRVWYLFFCSKECYEEWKKEEENRWGENATK